MRDKQFWGRLAYALCALACEGACGDATRTPSSPSAQLESTPQYFGKSKDFSPKELELVHRARELVRQRGIAVDGLRESLSLFNNAWCVAYRKPGYEGPGGGGWCVAFKYPSGEFLGIDKEQ